LKPREALAAFHPTVARGTLRTLMARAGVTVEQFMSALGR